MAITPTPATAALAGVWTSLGMIPFELWIRANAPESGGLLFAFWMVAAVVFLALPGYVLVVGRHRSFGKDWIHDPAERARYIAILKRIGIWLLSAALVGWLWSGLFGAGQGPG